MTKLGIVTIVHGRREHLARQAQWVAALDPAPHVHVVVAMNDPSVDETLAASGAHIVHVSAGAELPLSQARNRGVDEAGLQGCDAVALLDVDCLPEPGFVGDYVSALSQAAEARCPAVVTGRVRYLPEGLGADDYTVPRLDEVGRDHPARVVPPVGELVAADPNLLWSLNIAATVHDWDTIGGFDERYVGYGGEDTDFGQRLRAAGGELWWTAGAGAFHQWHPSHNPPVQHAVSIARNANVFRETWGLDPMAGWLGALEASGHIRWTDAGWVATDAG